MVRATTRSPRTLLEVKGAVKLFPLGKRSLWDRITGKTPKYIQAVSDVTFTVRGGETLAVLGESGSGKTTLGRLIVGLEKPDSGTVSVSGTEVRPVRERRAARGRLQMVFQDPSSSLDPFMKVLEAVAEPLTGSGLPEEARNKKVLEAMDLVGLDKSLLERRTSELSGGQKQRVSVARAIISDPEVIVLDEPTSSTDVSIQAQVLNLLVEIQRSKGYAYVLITHDPNVARFMADEVAVMYLGKVAEFGPSAMVLRQPKHPYTQALLSSAPKLGGAPNPTAISGEPPSMIDLPSGCRYSPRCPYAMEVCKQKDPPFYEAEGVSVACYLYDKSMMDKAGPAG